jgi:hypothetical protein
MIEILTDWIRLTNQQFHVNAGLKLVHPWRSP